MCVGLHVCMSILLHLEDNGKIELVTEQVYTPKFVLDGAQLHAVPQFEQSTGT